jgi:hypothetical protein
MLFGAAGITIAWIVSACHERTFVPSDWWQTLLLLAAIALYSFDYFSHRRGKNPPKRIMYVLLCFWIIFAALQARDLL